MRQKYIKFFRFKSILFTFFVNISNSSGPVEILYLSLKSVFYRFF